MKKVLFGLFALSTVVLAAETNLYLRAGADLNGKYDTISVEGYDLTEEDTDEFSYEFAVEATREIYPNLEVGVGLAYQKHGDPKTRKDSEVYSDGIEKDEYEMIGYTSIPLYLTAKYNFNAINNFVPYIKANLGYSFNDEDGDAKYKSIYIADYGTYPYSENYKVKLDNGLYYGIGAGFEYNNFTMDLMYQVNEADAEITSKEYPEDGTLKTDFDYSRVTLSFGYKFNF